MGIEIPDTPEKVKEATGILASLRVFEGDGGHLERSLKQVNAGLLLVPNFTVCATFSSGGRPSFDAAAGPDHANDLFEFFVEEASKRLDTVESGRFGADMDVRVENDGPVTVTLEV